MSSGLGSRYMCQIQGLSGSRQPVISGFPLRLYILTGCFDNVTVRLVSHIGPKTTMFSWNPGMTWPMVGKYEGSLG